MTNPFKVNHHYKEKHKILKALYDHWQDGERRTSYAQEVTDLGRSLSVLQLHDITKLQQREIELYTISLSNSGHIEMYDRDQDKNQKNHLWIITDSGQQAISDNYYLNQRGTENQNLLFQVGGFVIALIALVVSLYELTNEHLSEKDVEGTITTMRNKEQSQKIRTVSSDSTIVKTDTLK